MTGTNIIDAYALVGGDTDYVHTVIDGQQELSFQINNDVNLDAADAVVKLQESNDGVEFLDISGATITLPQATKDTNKININIINSDFYKVVVTVNSVTLGELTVTMNK